MKKGDTIQIFKTFSKINFPKNKGQKKRIEKHRLSKKKIFVFKKVEKTKKWRCDRRKKSTKDQSEPEGRTNGTRKIVLQKEKEKQDKKNKVKMWKKVDEQNEGRKIQYEN